MRTVAAAPAKTPLDVLSEREREVFHHMGQGRGTRRIAELLHVSYKTVHSYQARMKTKLGIGSITELLCEAVRWHARGTGDERAAGRTRRRSAGETE